MKKYKSWELLNEIPEGWRIDKTAGSPLCGYEFCTDCKSILNGGKRALVKIKRIPIIESSSNDEKLFPTILIVLDLCAAVVSFYHGDVRRGIYWISAGYLLDL